MTEIKLFRPHTHQRVQYQAGAVITVNQHDLDFIIAHNIGEPVKAPANKQKDKQNAK